MLTFILETLKDLHVIEDSLECLCLRVRLYAVGVPGCRIPGIEQVAGSLLIKAGEEDLSEGLAKAPHLPCRLLPDF